MYFYMFLFYFFIYLDALLVVFQSVVRWWSSAAEGAVAPPAECSITAEQAIRLWTQHFTLHGISEPLLSSQYIISHVLGEKTVSFCFITI